MEDKQILNDYILYITEDTANNYKKDNKINKKISINFLKDLLANNEYFNYLNNIFKSDRSSIVVRIKKENTISIFGIFTKAEIIKGLITVNNEYNFNDVEQNRLNFLIKLTSFDNYIEENKNKNYEISVDNNNYSISINKIIEAISLPEDKFKELCTNKEINTILGIPKEHFIYATYKFIEKNLIIQKYLVPNKLIYNFHNISSYIDIEAINTFLYTESIKLDLVNINNELREKVLMDMPSNLSKLEQAIYIYIMLCKTLTYDEEYYLNGYDSNNAIKHRDINYINKITPKNNKSVCYEHNVIYAKLLDELGINFVTTIQKVDGREKDYGSGHTSLEFRYNKYIIKADTSKEVFNSDLTAAKLNQPLTGLWCKNKNKQTVEEFENIVSKIYRLIAKNEEHIESFDEIVAKYLSTINNPIVIDFKEKINILIEKVNNANMTGIDSITYLLQLKSILFDNDNTLKLRIIKNNETTDERLSMATVILCIENSKDDYTYYIYNPNQKLIPISKEDLQSKFDNNKFEVINLHTIPGIEHGGIHL